MRDDGRMAERDRLRIFRVGTIAVENGEIIPRNWGMAPKFGEPDMPDEVELPPFEGLLGGWTAADLHVVAHGSPCTCPVADAIAHAASE